MNINNLYKLSFFTCLLLSAVACEKELSAPSSLGRNLCFTATEGALHEERTRSSAGGDSLLFTSITPLEAEGRTLYLHTTVTNGIEGGRLGKDGPLTRATPVSDMSAYGTFSVFAAFYQGTWSPNSQNMNFMYNVPVSHVDGKWFPQTNYYWPGRGYNVRFFAYAPIDAEFEPSNQSAAANDFHIKYEVPADVTKQKDLLVAKSAEYTGDYDNAVPLEFKHVLTAVRFVVGDDMKAGTVNKISLRNITSGGVYDPETGHVGKLIGQGIVKDFEQELNKVTDGTPGSAITEPFQTFMLPPQGFTDDSSSVIEIVFTDDEGEHTLSASLKGQIWKSGTTVTYKISTSSINWDYHLDVTGPNDFTYTGGTQQYSVTSYRQNSKGVKEAVQWSTQYSTDNGASWTANRPDWLTAFTAFGAGGETPQSYNATVSAQTGTSNNPHTSALQNAPAKGSENSPYNLANQTNGGTTNENTANCYVVSASGYYSLPLVYGNAIKNSVVNEDAYQSLSGNNFINHTGTAITDPYIKNAGCTPAKAELVWQDAPNLVTEIKYNNIGDGNVSFTVNKDYICQGNAVIAIKDGSNNILWSWHIWVTDEDINNKTIEVTNKQSKKYKFMPVNIGWSDGSTTSYAERSCKVKFTAGDKIQEITIKQAEQLIDIVGNNPYYQWGRKDPFLPSNKLDQSTKTWYDKDGNAYTENPKVEDLSTGPTCIMNYILKPNVMHHNQLNSDNYREDLWAHYSKTIYDPSPVGFILPDRDAFSGFTTTGLNTSNSSEINGIWDNSLRGYNFYTDSSKSKTIFFPASGTRNDFTGQANFVGTRSCYWTASINDIKLSRNLFFHSSFVGPYRFSTRTLGAVARPVRETDV